MAHLSARKFHAELEVTVISEKVYIASYINTLERGVMLQSPSKSLFWADPQCHATVGTEFQIL